jgi:hypothetical protein
MFDLLVLGSPIKRLIRRQSMSNSLIDLKFFMDSLLIIFAPDFYIPQKEPKYHISIPPLLPPAAKTLFEKRVLDSQKLFISG